MTDNTDHAAESRGWLDHAQHGATTTDEMNGDIGIAQVHATLALVAATEKVAEQARIANLIALAGSDNTTLVRFGYDALVEHLPAEGWGTPEDVQMHPHIREGMGL